MNLLTVRDELVEQLQSISGLNVSDRPPTTLQPPHAFINRITRIEPSQTYEGLVLLEFELKVLVAIADEDSAWDLLSGYCGTASGSVDFAINANSQLDSTVQFCDPVKWENVGEIDDEWPGPYRSAVARILVHTL